MKTHLLTLCILLGSIFSISTAYGDNIPTHGEWDDLTIRITDKAGNIMYENVLSGETGEIAIGSSILCHVKNSGINNK